MVVRKKFKVYEDGKDAPKAKYGGTGKRSKQPLSEIPLNTPSKDVGERRRQAGDQAQFLKEFNTKQNLMNIFEDNDQIMEELNSFRATSTPYTSFIELPDPLPTKDSVSTRSGVAPKKPKVGRPVKKKNVLNLENAKITKSLSNNNNVQQETGIPKELATTEIVEDIPKLNLEKLHTSDLTSNGSNKINSEPQDKSVKKSMLKKTKEKTQKKKSKKHHKRKKESGGQATTVSQLPESTENKEVSLDEIPLDMLKDVAQEFSVKEDEAPKEKIDQIDAPVTSKAEYQESILFGTQLPVANEIPSQQSLHQSKENTPEKPIKRAHKKTSHDKKGGNNSKTKTSRTNPSSSIKKATEKKLVAKSRKKKDANKNTEIDSRVIVDSAQTIRNLKAFLNLEKEYINPPSTKKLRFESPEKKVQKVKRSRLTAKELLSLCRKDRDPIDLMFVNASVHKVGLKH